MVVQLASMGSSIPEIMGNLPSNNCVCEILTSVHQVGKRAIDCYYHNTNRHVRNIINGSCATCLSYWGGAIAGDTCLRACLHLTSNNSATRIGSALAALGNLCSWISALEPEPDTENERRREENIQLKARLCVVESQNAQLQARADAQEKRIEVLEKCLALPPQKPDGQSF